MAGPQHDTAEFEPRRRIIGAIILVTLAFVVLSMVLQDQPSPSGSSAAPATTAPDTRVVVAPVPLPGATTANPASTLAARPAPATPARPTAPAPAKVAAAPTKPVPTKSKSKPEKNAAVPPSGNWIVQVGTFADPANARRLGKKLEANHFPVHLSVVTLAKSRAVRVQAGPFASKAKAVAARDEIARHLGVRGVVFARK